MLKVTPDANILIAGVLYRRGKCHQLLQKAITGEVNLTVSQPIIVLDSGHLICFGLLP